MATMDVSFRKYPHSKVLDAPSFNVKYLQYLLDHDNHESREAFKQHVQNNPIFVPRFNVRYFHYYDFCALLILSRYI